MVSQLYRQSTSFHEKTAEIRRIVYCCKLSGHRQSYLSHLGSVLEAEELSGPLNPEVRNQLVSTDQLLFTTLDDDVFAFVQVAIVRSFRGKATVALFLRPQSCFGYSLRSLVKGTMFRLLKRLPGLSIVTITPFALEPDYSHVAHASVYDPQYWDIPETVLGKPPTTDLSEEISAKAAGRPVVSMLGSLLRSKGTELLARMLEAEPTLADEVFWLCAGTVVEAERAMVSRLETAGAVLIDRFLSDEEIESIYGLSTAAWACYSPEYDQASGIFGRALQFGVVPVVRKGALTERFARKHGIETLLLDFECSADAAATMLAALKGLSVPSGPSPARSELVAGWRTGFFQTIEGALAGLKHETDQPLNCPRS